MIGAMSPKTTLANQPDWCLIGLPRQNLKQILLAMKQHGAVGEFLIRDASESPGPGELLNLKLSVKETERDVNTYLIVVKPNLARQLTVSERSNTVDHLIFQVLGTSNRFSSLGQLTRFYASPNYAPSFPVQLIMPQFTNYVQGSLIMPDQSFPSSPTASLVARIIDPEQLYDVGIDEYMEAIGVNDDGPIYDRGNIREVKYAWADNTIGNEATYSLASTDQDDEAIYDMAHTDDRVYDNREGIDAGIPQDGDHIYGLGSSVEHIYGLHDSEPTYDTRTLKQCS